MITQFAIVLQNAKHSFMIVRRKSIAEKVTYINAFVTFYLLQIAYLLRTFELLNLLASKYECNNETENTK